MSLTRLDKIKTAVLPDGKRCRRLPFGIGRGIKLDIDFAVQTKLYLGLYEVELNKYLRRLCRPGFNSFDVGGQFGYDALVFAKLSGGSVASFECDHEAARELSCNISYNENLRSRVHIVEAFVGSKSDPMAGTLSLDDAVFSGQLFVPDFIKIDIEGAEYDALLGARRILENYHPNLLVETHSVQLEQDCIELVESLGFDVTVVDARRYCPDYRPIEHNRWFVATMR